MDLHRKRRRLREMIYCSDITCYNQIRMYRSTFDQLCSMLVEIGGLKPTKNMLVDEQVAIFLHIIAHDLKNRLMQFEFGRSRETISRYFNVVLKAMILLNRLLFKTPEPNCLGALDGTHIKIKVLARDKPRYRSQKGDISTNVLGVCSQDGQFIYVLPGWEGSVADDGVLHDAINRPNGLKVSQGQYYLVDAGYTNCEGFLAPYRGQRYHLNEWREGQIPTTHRECFNMKHSRARNIIERCFGILKAR
ncbi:hypothetical protein L6164_026071 [Bauhinia variegata]|uniref:Uncharacterized protein n=1 Tax=Bauhinia variegata TaxID=167791 RepID=A0ACB9M2D3_BAUVA|nr:hypothetical protein L6164_026071 [Bauhinia variegata]